MSDNDFIDVPGKDDWNDNPQPVPPAPQAPEIQAEQAAQEAKEPEPVFQEDIPPVPELEAEVFSEPLQAQPVPPLYDPVATESEPYVEVTPKQDGFEPAPAFVPTEPPKEKKNKTWTIVLIILLVLCVCVFIGIGIVLILVASGDYTIEWSYLLNDLVRLL